MTKYILSKSDIEELTTIINIGKSIEEHYKELAKLEIERKKDTPEYKSCIEKLKVTISLEDALFEKMTTSAEKVIELMEYMKKNFGGGYTLETPFFEIAANENYYHIKEARVYKRLNNYLNSNFPKYINEELSELFQFFSQTDPTYLKKLITKLDTKIHVNETLLDEQYLFVLRKLEDEIESPLSKNDRNKLINAKYRFIFMSNRIEKKLLADNFKVSNEIYFCLNFIAAINGINETELDMLKEAIAIRELYNEIISILSHKDIEYKVSNLLVELKIRKIVIRGLLQILTDDQVMATNDAFHTLIEEKNFDNGENNIGIKAIRDAYKLYKRDKQNIVTLSLIKKNNN